MCGAWNLAATNQASASLLALITNNFGVHSTNTTYLLCTSLVPLVLDTIHSGEYWPETSGPIVVDF